MGEEIKFVELGEICEFRRGVSVHSKNLYNENVDGRLIPWIRIGNMKESGLDFNNLKWVDPFHVPNIEKFIIKPREILLSKDCSIGTITFNNSNINVLCSGHILIVKPKQEIVLRRYLLYVLLQRKKKIASLRTIGIMPSILLEEVARLKIPLPSIEKQEKIAKWLDTFTSLERQKMRYQYYLNRLTRGGQLISLKEIVKEHYKGTLITKSQITEVGTPCIRYGEIYTTYDIWFDKPASHIQLEEGKKYKYCDKNDLMVTTHGELISEIAKPLAYIGNVPIILGNNLISIKHNQNAKYLSYALSNREVEYQKKRSFNPTATISYINADHFLKLQVHLPDLNQQNKIANWLDKFRELTDQSTGKLSREILLLKQQSKYYSGRLIN